jgi:Amt family ammonium transporter
VAILENKSHNQERNLIGKPFQTNEIIDSGDTAWMLAATALVLLMTLPGLSLYYAGMSNHPQNMMTTAMHAFSTAGLITLVWLMFGYSLTFNSGSPVIGDYGAFWLSEFQDTPRTHPLAPTIPEALHCAFQLAFAIVTASLMLGASGDRMRFFPMLAFVIIWHLLVYCPIAHSNWSHDGFLNKAGIIDYAGGNVVHISAGMSGLASSYVLGKRYGYGNRRFAPQNILYTITGACFLWVGWYGFNAGSAYGANSQAAMALLMTQIATSAASFSWMAMDYFVSKKLTVLGLLCGAIAGLVAITPAAGYVDSTGAFFIGLLSGPACYYGIQLKKRLGFDDSLDAFGLHGIAGIYGGLMTGLFAKNFGTTGAFYGHGRQLGLQIYGVAVCAAYSFFMTMAILVVLDLTWGIRVSQRAEKLGLDRSCHNEGLYVEKSSERTPEERVADLLRSYAEATNVPLPDFLNHMGERDGGREGSLSSDDGHDELNDSNQIVDIENPPVTTAHARRTDPSSSPSTRQRKLHVRADSDLLDERAKLASLITVLNKTIISSSQKNDTDSSRDFEALSKRVSSLSSLQGPASTESLCAMPRRNSDLGSPARLSRKKSVSFSMEEDEVKRGESPTATLQQKLEKARLTSTIEEDYQSPSPPPQSRLRPGFGLNDRHAQQQQQQQQQQRSPFGGKFPVIGGIPEERAGAYKISGAASNDLCDHALDAMMQNENSTSSSRANHTAGGLPRDHAHEHTLEEGEGDDADDDDDGEGHPFAEENWGTSHHSLVIDSGRELSLMHHSHSHSHSKQSSDSAATSAALTVNDDANTEV